MSDKFIVRAAEMIGAYGVAGTMPDQVDAETIAMARCELIRQSMELFIKFCYKRDGNGLFCHLSGNTFIPRGVFVPWGSAGKPRRNEAKTRAQLSKDERKIVRIYLDFLKRKRLFPVFVYSAAARRWTVDTMRYATEEAALAWLKSQALDPRNFIAIKAKLAATNAT